MILELIRLGEVQPIGQARGAAERGSALRNGVIVDSTRAFIW